MPSDSSYTQMALMEMRAKLEKEMREQQEKLANIDKVLGMLAPNTPAPQPQVQRAPSSTAAPSSFAVQPINTAPATVAPVANRRINTRQTLSFLSNYPLSVTSFLATGGVAGNISAPVNRAFQVIAGILAIMDAQGAFLYRDLYQFGHERGMWQGKTTLYGPLNRLVDYGIVTLIGDGLWVVSSADFFKLVDTTGRPTISQSQAMAEKLTKERKAAAAHPRRVVDEHGNLIPTVKSVLLTILENYPLSTPIVLRKLQEELFLARGRRSSIFVIESTMRYIQRQYPVFGLVAEEVDTGTKWTKEQSVKAEPAPAPAQPEPATNSVPFWRTSGSDDTAPLPTLPAAAV